MNPRNDIRKNSPNLVSIDEVRFLRSRVATLEKQLQGSSAPAPASTDVTPTKTVVEHKIDPRIYGALRDLLVAAENHFGPEPGVKGPKLSKEMKSAMEAAAKLVRKEKKP